MRVWRVRAEQPEQGGGVCVGRDVPEQSMRCWPRQKVLLLPLQPLMSLAVPLQLSTLRAAVDAAAALPPPLLARALLLPPPLLRLPLPLLPSTGRCCAAAAAASPRHHHSC